jgi:hypothetical protein
MDFELTVEIMGNLEAPGEDWEDISWNIDTLARLQKK